MNTKELTIRQIGEYCTSTHCSKCAIKKWNEESGPHNDCMESLRLKPVADIMLKQIKHKNVNRDYDEVYADEM